jgi:hypothetical protein
MPVKEAGDTSLRISIDARDRRAEVSGGVVPEFEDPRMSVERRLHDAALDSSTAAVDQPHFRQAGGRCGVHVLGDEGRNVGGSERVEVELAFDRNPDGAISQAPPPAPSP